ncbi:hypothetical protein AOLI_G00199540 [Acnodon oligacanthus]
MSLTWRDTHTYRALCRSLPGLFSLPILGGSQDLAPQSPPNTPTDQQNMSEPHRGSVAAEADSLGGACWAFSLPEATFQYLLCAASRPYRWPLPSSLDPSVAEKSRVLE